jgi:cell division protein FtsI (penicillin-binding protein 3)
MASFAGFVPAESPRLSIIVSIDDPQGDHFGGTVAAPLFSQVAAEALRALGVPPSGSSATSATASAPTP